MEFKNPKIAADIIIEYKKGIVLIERKFEPFGWALPGGFIEYAETIEETAIREAKEETNLEVILTHLLYVYSDPQRDKRHHTISTVFIATGSGDLKAQDDAKNFQIVDPENIPVQLAFDHSQIISDYLTFKNLNKLPSPKLILKN